MSDELSALSERVRAARAELDASVAEAQSDLARVKDENRTTLEEHHYLQAVALRGDLGADMQELARRIDRGEDTWDQVFSGDSPNVDLLRGHVDWMYAQHAQPLAEALNEDAEFQHLLQEFRGVSQPVGDTGSAPPPEDTGGSGATTSQPADQPRAGEPPPRVHGDEWDEDADFYTTGATTADMNPATRRQKRARLPYPGWLYIHQFTKSVANRPVLRECCFHQT